MMELNASEALYGFMGWLTSRDKKVVLSAKHNAAEAAELVARFCDENQLPHLRAGWENNIKHPD